MDTPYPRKPLARMRVGLDEIGDHVMLVECPACRESTVSLRGGAQSLKPTGGDLAAWVEVHLVCDSCDQVFRWAFAQGVDGSPAAGSTTVAVLTHESPCVVKPPYSALGQR